MNAVAAATRPHGRESRLRGDDWRTPAREARLREQHVGRYARYGADFLAAVEQEVRVRRWLWPQDHPQAVPSRSASWRLWQDAALDLLAVDRIVFRGPAIWELDDDLLDREWFLPPLLRRAVATLDPREQRVVHLRYGLLDGSTRTLEAVAREFGCTRERVRQIEAKALRKLRHPSRSRALEAWVPGQASATPRAQLQPVAVAAAEARAKQAARQSRRLLTASAETVYPARHTRYADDPIQVRGCA